MSKKVQASGGSHMSSLMSSKGWVNGLVFPSMGILIVPFTLKQKKLAKPNIFEVPTPLSKLVIKVLMVSKWGRQTYLDSVCLQQPLFS